MILRLPSILFFGGLLLFCASTSFGQGEYQQTRNNKTMVWNATPRPGETSSWAGHRDKENYASGFGDLTWYDANGKVFALYYGNMVHGKLEGPVNLHSNGRTAHAYFVDGGRVTGWARGRAPSKMAVPEEVIVEKRKAEAEKVAAAAKSEVRAAPALDRHLAATAAEAEKKPKTEPEKIRPIVTKPAATPSEPTPPTIAEKKSERRSAEDELPRRAPPSTRTERDASVFEPTPIPNSEAFSQPSIQEAPPVAEGPATEGQTEATDQTSEIARESWPAPTKKRSSADISLNALVGPPSSLRTTPDASPPKMESEISSSRESAPLTEAEAINLADTEARMQGYHLDDYQRPKVDHSAVKGKWSLFYGLKEGSNGGTFAVTVEDKTKKVEIRK